MFNWQMISFQDPATFIMKYFIYFHDSAMMILILITSLILYIILILSINKFSNLSIMHGQTIELMWTIIPMIVLILLAIPSIQILYMTEEIYNPNLTIKSIGHQWYWSYEYADFNNINFDSFMVNDINLNSFRLLDVDNNMIIPYNLPIRMIISSDDVIHSWTMPSLGIKLDAIPGRLNQTYFMIIRTGLFYGQCSEICGVNHSFMPICVESTNPQNFINWIKFMLN